MLTCLRILLAVPILAGPAAGSRIVAQTPALSTEIVAARSLPATVTIVTLNAEGDTLGLGSGFLVRSTGVIVTNHHVMAGAHSAVVILASGERYERVEALDADPKGDLAILKIPGYGLPVIPTTAMLPPVGARLVTIGNPLGLSRTVSEGIVSAVRLVDGRELLQMSTAISPGSSGGPVLNERGEVVAIATSYLEDGQNLNFAVPVRYALGLIESPKAAPLALADVFGSADRMDPTGNAAAGTAQRRPMVVRTQHPRATITGAWAINQHGKVHRERGETQDYDFTGFLFLGEHDLGILALLPDGDPKAHVIVSPVATHIATPDGRVSIVSGGFAYDGYQTENGFLLTSTDSVTRGTVDLSLLATAAEVPLSNPSGLYELGGRTDMHVLGSETQGDATWAGEAAVVVANDSVYIDIYLTNEAGGNTVVTGEAPLHGGSFAFTRHGKSVDGAISRGRLHLDWTDRRDWGYYQGRLSGRRK